MDRLFCYLWFDMSTGTIDRADVVLNIGAAEDTAECNDWVKMLLRMYGRYCEAHGLKYEVVADQPGRASVQVTGADHGRFKAEHGVHRLSRISPFDPNRRRHTSFASVDVAQAGHGPASPSSQYIRAYILSPRAAVVDLRTGFTADIPEKVLDGDLDQFIDAWSKAG
jgi:protein subunit release factor B